MFLNKKPVTKSKASKGTLHNPKILDVNLIKGEVGVSFDWQKNLFTLVIVLLITGLFVTEIYFGLDWWEKQENLRAQTLENKVLQVSQQVRRLKTETNKALNYKAKTFELSKLLADHVYWTNFFNWLERNTLSTVNYSDFSGNLSGQYSLQASTKNFADISWQVKSFLDDPITKSAAVAKAGVTVDKKTNNEKINFIINLKIKPTIFKK